MTSPFIEHSKHAQMTSAVESHFGTAKSRTMPGEASGNSFSSGGDQAWNAGKPDPLPDHGGFNYSPKADIGHTVKDDPFSVADGFPGN